MIKLLFVCLGNICRSPSAEAIMQKLVASSPLKEDVYCDSAGTNGYHSGEHADSRMRASLTNRDYPCSSRSRRVDPAQDFDDFDYILAMDSSNYDDLMELARVYSKKTDHIYMMSAFKKSRSETDVPDPYYGGAKGFDTVIDILEDSCLGLLEHLQNSQTKVKS